MNLPVFPIGYPWLKVYIAHRQTCPNCSSSCYANDHICYDSARRGSSSTTMSCRSAVETLRSTLLRKGACFIQRYVAVRARLTPRLRSTSTFSRVDNVVPFVSVVHFRTWTTLFLRVGYYRHPSARTCEAV